MRLSDDVKTALAWIGLLLLVPNAILAARSVGIVQWSAGLTFLLVGVIVWRWRAFLNHVRNIETTHSFTVVNTLGDVVYERQTSLLPLLWPIRKTELLISLSGKEARIESVEVSCPVEWYIQGEKSWHGVARPHPHRPLLWAFRHSAGTRIVLTSVWKRAVLDPPHDFLVACGPRCASRIHIKARWSTEMTPEEVTAEVAPFPANELVEKEMVDTTRIPWTTIKTLDTTKEEDGSMRCSLWLEPPKKSSMYRIVWAPGRSIPR